MVYEGNEKYIFVSYAHKDADRVLPVIDALNANGFRVWYDSGIEAGTEWPEYIEDHLMWAHIVLVFLSPAAVESRNCRNEINFALELKKELLVIYLEETTLQKGMRLQLNSTQSMFRAHHNCEETFIRELVNARILQECRGDEVTTPVSAPAPVSAPQKEKKNLPLIIMLGAVFVALVVLICLLAFGGKDEVETPTESTTVTEETVAPTVPMEMSDEIYDFTVKLEGTVCKLPFPYQDLTTNGWTISSSGYSDTTLIPGNSYESFTMSNNGKRLTVTVYNKSGNAKQVKDCLVGGLGCSAGDNILLELAKGITPNSTLDEILAAYGVPTYRNDDDEYTSAKYQPDDSYDRVYSFMIYHTDEMRKYSEISVRNFAATDDDITETNPQRPEYLDTYKAPSELSTDYNLPIAKIGGDLYQLPAPVSVFTDNGWKVSHQPSAVAAGNKEYITVERDGVKMDLDIVNFAQYQTTPENCAVYRINIQASENIDAELPNGVMLGLTIDEVKELVTEDFYYYEGTYRYSWSYSQYEPIYVGLDIYVDIETMLVNELSVSCETWSYE